MYDFEYRINHRIARLERTMRQLTGILMVALVIMFVMALTIATRLM